MPIWYLAHAYLVFGSCLFGIWLMPIWYLAHAYLVFGSCLFGIWLMPFWYLAHAFLVFGSCLFERTSEGILWKIARAKFNWIFLKLRTSENRTTEIRMSQGPAVSIIISAPKFSIIFFCLLIIFISSTTTVSTFIRH